MNRVYYFAYGADMAAGQIGERCPSAEVVGAARLAGRRLAFTRYSDKWRCGVADAVADATSEIWGVLYTISEDDLIVLDRRQGYRGEGKGNDYVRRRCEVTVVDEGGEETYRDVQFYVVEKPHLAVDGRGIHKPGRVYKQLMVTAGRSRGLPREYVEMLEALETQ